MAKRSVECLVRAVTESSRAYLEFLEKHKVAQRHSVTGLSQAEEPYCVDGRAGYLYHCVIEPHRAITPGTEACFIPYVDGASEMPVHIKSYDRVTGRSHLVFREEVRGKAGSILVDFRWLVDRCRRWYAGKGNTIHEPGAIPNPEPVDEGIIAEALDASPALSEEQQEAVEAILTKPISYTWGPPGTGKTLFVLAKAANVLCRAGRRVLVLASTNLAVDNALEAILAESIPSTAVVRIGIPSEKFLKDHPDCCEQRAFQQEIQQYEAQQRILEAERQSLQVTQECRTSLKRIENDLTEGDERLSLLESDLREKRLTYGTRVAERDRLQSCLAEADDELRDLNEESSALGWETLREQEDSLQKEQVALIDSRAGLRKQIDGLGLLVRVFTRTKARLLDKDASESRRLGIVESSLAHTREQLRQKRPKHDELSGRLAEATGQRAQLQQSLSDLEPLLSAVQSEKGQISEQVSALRNRARTWEGEKGSTLSRMERHSPQLSEADIQRRLAECKSELEDLARIIRKAKIDLSEKQVLGMTLDGFIGLSMNYALSFDHVLIDEAPYAPLAKVLPVLSLGCPIGMLGDHKQLPPVCENKQDETVRAYWAKESIFLEDAFRLGEQYTALAALQKPTYHVTDRRNLTTSYRFGPSLAGLLDAHIYENMGLQGRGDGDTNIKVIDAQPDNARSGDRRENYAEAEAIVSVVQAYVAMDPNERPSLAVLTPYIRQMRLVRKVLLRSGLLEHVEVLNTHKAQGREWDIVVFSVSDTDHLRGVHSPYYTDTTCAEGRAVVNTTVSRAKTHLRLVLDKAYWKSRKQSCLVGDIARM